MRASTKAATGALAALAAVAVIAPAAAPAAPVCVDQHDPTGQLFGATACVDSGRQGATVAPWVDVTCGGLQARICNPLLSDIGVGKTGVEDGLVWVAGQPLIVLP